jgi:pimeloyl-ACP methyl ester carboxylesterase
LFVHGLLVNGDLWRKVVPLLAGEFRCITPDWPLGSHEVPLKPTADLSPPGLVEVVASFLGALDLDDVTLVGNDTGGALCQLVVAKHPEKIGRLILTNCDAFENFPPAVFRHSLPFAHLPGSMSVVAAAMNWGPSRSFLFRTLAKREIGPEILDSYCRPVSSNRGVRIDLGRILRNAGGASRYTLAAAKKFPEFRKPVLIAWAPEDRFFKWKYAERLAEAFPDARLERIDDSLTFVPEDQPERLASVISAFLGQNPSAGAASNVEAASS